MGHTSDLMMMDIHEIDSLDGKTPHAHIHGKYDNNGKGWYFRFDVDNKMSYQYYPVDHLNWMGQFNTYNI